MYSFFNGLSRRGSSTDALFVQSINEQKSDCGEHCGDSGHDKGAGIGAAGGVECVGDGVEGYGRKTEGQHDHAVIGGGILGAKEVGGSCGADGGLCAERKRGNEDNDEVERTTNKDQQQCADKCHCAENGQGRDTSQFVREGGHEQTTCGVGDTGERNTHDGSRLAQSALNAKSLNKRSEHIPSTVIEECAREQQPERQHTDRLRERLGFYAGNSCGGEVQTVQIGLIGQRDLCTGEQTNAEEDDREGAQRHGQRHAAKQRADDGRKHNGREAECRGGKSSGKAALVGEPFLDAGKHGTIGKTGAHAGDQAIGEVKEDNGCGGGEQGSGENTTAKECYTGNTHGLGADAVLQDAADKAAETEAHQHIGCHKVDSTIFPTKVGDGGLLENAPQIEDADAQLYDKTADYGAQELGTRSCFHMICPFLLKCTGIDPILSHKTGVIQVGCERKQSQGSCCGTCFDKK